jgi:basic membrane protein A
MIMKKSFGIVMALLMVVTMAVFGGGAKQGSAGGKKGVVYFCLNLGDLSFNDSGWAGTQQAAAKYGYDPTVIELGKDTSTYESAFVDACDSGKYSVVVSQSNYGLADMCAKYAPQYPDLKFIAFDMSTSAKITNQNMFGIAYKQNEGSFLVGALAAALSKSGKVGTYIFNDVPVGNDFLAGYIDGARAMNPKVRVSYAYGGGNADAAKMQEVTSAMFDSGVDIIYGVFGSSNLGLFQEVIRRGGPKAGFYAIGVDSDQYTLYKNSQNALLADAIVTSMLKNVGDSIVWVFDQWEAGTLKWGTVTALGIKENGVGVADNSYYRGGVVPQKALSAVDEIRAKVVSGSQPVKSYFDFKDYTEFAAWRDR